MSVAGWRLFFNGLCLIGIIAVVLIGNLDVLKIRPSILNIVQKRITSRNLSRYNATFDIEQGRRKKTPKWIFSLVRSIKSFKRLPDDLLEVIHKHRKFYSWPPFKLEPNLTKDLLSYQEDNVTIPNIVHVTWFYPGPHNLKFYHAVSLLSVNRYIKPKKILFWCNNPPAGEWWTYINKKIPNIQVAHRPAPNRIFGKRVTIPQHKSDIARFEALLYFGGIYLDLDVIIVKPFNPLYNFTLTMGEERKRSLNTGAMLSAPNSLFIWIMYLNYFAYDRTSWGFNSLITPRRIARTYPELIHIEYQTMAKPSWPMRSWLYHKKKIWHWRKNYCVHFYSCGRLAGPTPENIKQQDTTLGQVFRYIYYGSPEIIR